MLLLKLIIIDPAVIADLPQHMESLATQLQLIACAIRSMEFGSPTTSDAGVVHSLTDACVQSLHAITVLARN